MSRANRPLLVAALVTLTVAAPAALGELYFYRAPDGHKVLSDRPITEPGYYLVKQQGSVRGNGRIVERKAIPIGGPPPYRHYISRASERYRVDPALIEAIIQVESNFDPWAVSKKGASGLMQLMAATARSYDLDDVFNPERNIEVGVRHLKVLLNRYRGSLPLALAAYNAGESNVERYRGVPPFRETREYIDKVLDLHDQIRRSRMGGQ